MARSSFTGAGEAGRDAELFEAVSAFYEAALSPDLWPVALSRLSRLCGAEWTILSAIPIKPMMPGTTVQNEGADPARLQLFSRRYTSASSNPATTVLLGSTPGRIILQEECFSDRDWEKTDLYNEIYRPAGVHASLGVPLLRSDRYLVPIGMMRTRSRGRYEKRDLDRLAILVPHLQNAARMMLRLETLGAWAGAMQESWDQLAVGVILLDAAGRLLWSNRTGASILSRHDGLYLRADRLAATASSASSRLQALIGQIALTGAGKGLFQGGGVSVPRSPPARPLSITLMPLPPARSRKIVLSDAARAVTVAFVSDPDLDRTPPATLLRQLYCLTEREAELATLLLQGLDPAEASEEMRVSRTTARTYLRQLFDKTNTRRQSELIRLLLRSTVVLGAPLKRGTQHRNSVPPVCSQD